MHIRVLVYFYFLVQGNHTRDFKNMFGKNKQVVYFVKIEHAFSEEFRFF